MAEVMGAATLSDDAKKGVVAHRKHQSLSETRRRAAAECKPKMMDDMLKTTRASCPGLQDTLLETLREDAPIA